MRAYASSRANECVERDGINRTIWVKRNKSQRERERERETRDAAGTREA